MLSEDVRVHDARIATFGERVEDFFLLTDRANAPLDAQRQQRLLQALLARIGPRSEEHTSELQSLMRISYAVFCLKKKKEHKKTTLTTLNSNRPTTQQTQ